MSSTSSSECLCSECFNYAAAYRSPSFRTRAPYYQTMGRPLIYYAQVQPSNFRPRSRETRKGNPNCFVKAFRWYTQDHYPQENRHLPSDRTDLNGFAMWLDKKYDEFILEKHAEQDMFQGQPQQPTEPSLMGTEILCSCTELDNSEKKSLASRLKSPFMKRRPRTEYSKESGDTPDKCNQSLEYILKPKELSRPTSECSHLLASSENSKKTVKMKAHSSDTTTVHEKSDVVPLSRSGVNDIEGSNGKRDNIAGSNGEKEGSNSKKPEIKAIEYQKITPENAESGIKSLKDVSCQGPEVTLVCVDEPVQCDISCKDKTWTDNPVPRYSCCPACSLKNQSQYSTGPSQNCEDELKIKTPEISKRESTIYEFKSETTVYQYYDPATRKKDLYIQCNMDYKIEKCTIKDNFGSTCQASSKQAREPVPILVQCPSLRRACAVRPPTVVRHQSIALDPKPLIINDMETEIRVPPRPNSPNITFDSIEAQTSDYPICLEPEQGYPLFMKIICADKLTEDCKCRK